MSVSEQKSSTVSKSGEAAKADDRRVRRTLRHLGNAFADLLGKRSYAAIRVSDITRKADVGRATFYAHYDGKDDLLSAEFARILDFLLVPRPQEPYLVDATGLFAHLRQARHFYRSLTQGPDGAAASRRIQDVLEDRIAGVLHARGAPASPLPAAVVPRYVAASLHALITWWAEGDMRQTPEELQAIFAALVGRGVGAVL
jgi:AcrR family transcriptional regulator